MSLNQIGKIIEFLDSTIEELGRNLKAPEANQLLEKAGILHDNTAKPGLPLRRILRTGKLPYAYQMKGKHSTWIIPHSASKKKQIDEEQNPKKNNCSDNISNDKENIDLKVGLPPVIDINTTVLILGTLPGDKSIRLKQYYADSRNDFWKLISKLINENITSLSYELKVKRLLNNGIGLWDVFKCAKRTGSKDSAIENGTLNDFLWIKDNYPNIGLICFNGQKAGKYERDIKIYAIKTLVIPSSSGANRQNNNKREQIWRSILG